MLPIKFFQYKMCQLAITVQMTRKIKVGQTGTKLFEHS